jgi:hypothetical protein
MELLSTERVTFPTSRTQAYQEMWRAKRKNTVCAIVIGFFVAKVERIPRRLRLDCDDILGDRSDVRSILAMNNPMK